MTRRKKATPSQLRALRELSAEYKADVNHTETCQSTGKLLAQLALYGKKSQLIRIGRRGKITWA